MKTMSLDGGIELYGRGTRYGSGIAPAGRQVLFLSENGRDSELERARKFFQRGELLTIKEIEVGMYSSEVEFDEYPGKTFNTVMFADYEQK